jgi:hypothetical protein
MPTAYAALSATVTPFSRSLSETNLPASGRICRSIYPIDTTSWHITPRRIEIGKTSVDRVIEGGTMSWLGRLHQARAEWAEHEADPWRRVLERAVPASVTSISTAALLDLLDVPQTTGNARRLAETMRSMGWVGLKSRRLMPGGFRDTTIRGWARPVREAAGRIRLQHGETVAGSHPDTQTHSTAA